MTDCKGIFGKIFGHKFISLKLKDAFDDKRYHFHTDQIESILQFMDSQRGEYEIRCKRCGAKADE